MDIRLPMENEGVGTSNLTKEEKTDSSNQEAIWRSRQERMNNALAAAPTEVKQDPAEIYAAARTLEDVINGADVEEFISMIERLAGQTHLPAVLDFQGLSMGSLLHVAAGSGKDDILKLLLDYGPYRLFIAVRNDRGDTLFHMATKARGSGAAAMLIHWAKNMLVDVEDLKTLLGMTNKHGNTALHEAVLNCHVETVNLLLGEDPELVYLRNKEGKSPLYLALDTNEHILEALFSLSLEPSRIEGLPPVHGAVVRRDYGLLAQILEWNKELFAMTDSKGGNLFHFAAHTNRARVFELLRPETEHLARQRDRNGDLPIHIASKMGYVELIKKLYPVSDFPNRRGQTVLHIAAKYGQASAVRYILRHQDLGKLINERDYDGNTPLHLGAIYSQPAALIPLVLDKRIRPFLHNHQTWTARDFAVYRFKWHYPFREGLAALVLQSTCDVTTDLLVRIPEDRDKAFSKVHSVKQNADYMKDMKDAINTRLLVAALVATVTFTAGFTVPGGLNGSDKASKDEQGMATMLDKKFFQAFVICNTIAMFSSMMAVVSLMSGQIDLNRAVIAFDHASALLTIALPAMSAAFLIGVTLTVGKLPWLANTTFSLGLFCLLFLSGAIFLKYIHVFESYRRPTCWLVFLTISLFRVQTSILDDQDEDGERTGPPLVTGKMVRLQTDVVGQNKYITVAII